MGGTRAVTTTARSRSCQLRGIKRTITSTTMSSLTDHKKYLVEATAVNDRLFCYLYDGDGEMATVIKGTSHMHTSGTVGLRTDTEVWFRNMIVMAWGGH